MRFRRALVGMGLGLTIGTVVFYAILVICFGLGLYSSYAITKYWYHAPTIGGAVGRVIGLVVGAWHIRVHALIAVAACIAGLPAVGIGIFMAKHGAFLDWGALTSYVLKQVLILGSTACATSWLLTRLLDRWMPAAALRAKAQPTPSASSRLKQGRVYEVD